MPIKFLLSVIELTSAPAECLIANRRLPAYVTVKPLLIPSLLPLKLMAMTLEVGIGDLNVIAFRFTSDRPNRFLLLVITVSGCEITIVRRRTAAL